MLQEILDELQRRGWPPPTTFSSHRALWGTEICGVGVNLHGFGEWIATTWGMWDYNTRFAVIAEASIGKNINKLCDGLDKIKEQLHPDEIPCLTSIEQRLAILVRKALETENQNARSASSSPTEVLGR